MRVAVFVDGANFFYMQKHTLRWWADPKKIYAYVEGAVGPIEDAYYYVGQDSPSEAQMQAYLDALVEMGYSIVTKPIKTIIDSRTGNEVQKANLDVEIVLDMFNTIDSYDCAVLVSGDGDFVRPLELLRARGKRFEVMSARGTIARELRAVAGRHFIDFAGIRREVEKV